MWDRKDEALRAVVRDARGRLKQVYVGEHLVRMVAEVNNTSGSRDTAGIWRS